jgi:hypothetical protein
MSGNKGKLLAVAAAAEKSSGPTSVQSAATLSMANSKLPKSANSESNKAI